MGKKAKNFIDLTNQKFHYLTVIKFAFNTGKPSYSNYWKCQCKCGKELIVSTNSLRMKNTKSCGCWATKKLIKRNTKHSLSYSRFYNIWYGIIRRCTYKKSWDFKYYGGRGIKNLWISFKNFKKDMYKKYLKHAKKFGEKQTTIDRIDNNGHYCKENCKWSTILEQKNNTRRLRRIEYNKKNYNLNTLSKKLKISPSLLSYRIRKKWNPKIWSKKPLLGNNQTFR